MLRYIHVCRSPSCSQAAATDYLLVPLICTPYSVSRSPISSIHFQAKMHHASASLLFLFLALLPLHEAYAGVLWHDVVRGPLCMFVCGEAQQCRAARWFDGWASS
ncbi:hypothetical protein V8C37DRAFT_391082 [Trichoderma ceciliae]